jgi:hypothetical protein
MSRTNRIWLLLGAIALAIAASGLWFQMRTRAASDQKYFCWDAPSRGTAAKYFVAFDNGSPVETTGECVRVPLDLAAGNHVASVRAVDAGGQSSPTAALTFSTH